MSRLHPGNVLGQSPAYGTNENATYMPWGRHHSFSAIIREYGSESNFAPLGSLIQSMKGAYYAARSVQSAEEDPTCAADQLAAAIVKLDNRLQIMSNDNDYCGDWLDTCSVPINDRYQIALENFFDPIDTEYTEIYEKFLAAKTNALITLSQKPDGVGYAKQIVASSTHLIEQTLEDLPRSGMLEEFLGNRSSNVPKQNMGLKTVNFE